MSIPAIPAAIVSSLLAVLLAGWLFRDRPATRRSFLMLLSLVLLVVPALCVLLGLELTVGVTGWLLPTVGAEHGQQLFPWLFGSGLLWSAVLVGRLVAARWRVHRLPRCDDGAVTALVGELAGRVGIRGTVTVHLSCVGPASTTLAGPAMMLPPGVGGWSDATRRAVVAHELVHVARRDDAWINLARLVSCLFWWLPWLQLLPRWLEQAAEESCDDRAAALVGSDRGYLTAVYGVARAARGTADRPVLAGVGMISSRPSLVARFQRFGRPRQQQLDSSAVYWATLGFAFGLCLVWSLRLEGILPESLSGTRLIAVMERATDEGDLTLRIALPPGRPLAAMVGRAAATEHAGAGPPR